MDLTAEISDFYSGNRKRFADFRTLIYYANLFLKRYFWGMGYEKSQTLPSIVVEIIPQLSCDVKNFFKKVVCVVKSRA